MPKNWLKTTAAGRKVKGAEHLRLEEFVHLLHARIDQNPVSPLIDALARAFLPGNDAWYSIDWKNEHFDFRMDELAAGNPKYADYVIGWVRKPKEVLGIPRHGDFQPTHSIKAVNQKVARIQWHLNRPRFANTRLTIRCMFRVVHTEDLAAAIQLRLCRAYPKPSRRPGSFLSTGSAETLSPLEFDEAASELPPDDAEILDDESDDSVEQISELLRETTDDDFRAQLEEELADMRTGG